MCQRVSRGRRTHTLEHAAAWHWKERSEGRRAEEKVKRSRKKHFNHVMTTEGSRAGADVTTRARAPCLGRVECLFQDCCVQLLLALALRSVQHEPDAHRCWLYERGDDQVPGLFPKPFLGLHKQHLYRSHVLSRARGLFVYLRLTRWTRFCPRGARMFSKRLLAFSRSSQFSPTVPQL